MNTIWSRCCWYSFYCCVFLIKFTEENMNGCDQMRIGILYDDMISSGFQGHSKNNCQLYSTDFSETYFVLQTALRIRKNDLEVILVPSYASKLIHIITEKYLNTTSNDVVSGDCLTQFKELETLSSTNKGSSRHLLITESGNYAEVQTAASLTSSIFRQLEWKLTVVFFDYSYASFVDEFTERLNKESNIQMLYNTDRYSNEGELLQLLKELYTDLADHHINFTILCNSENTRMLLKLASDFDQTKDNFRQTSLRDHSSWFVVTAASSIDEDIGTNESILDNVVLLNLLNLHREEQNAEIDRYKMEDGVYYLYTLMWKARARCSPKCILYRKFETIGCIRSNGTVGIHSAYFPNSNFGFNFRHMIVTTIWWPPFTERMQKNGKTVNYYGYCMDLLRELGKSLNFTYSVTEPVDGEFGRMLDNGSWSGMVGQLERREVDLMVATTSVRPDREIVMDFTIPFYYDTSTLLMKKPDPNEKKLLILAKPLHWKVMMCTGIILVVSAFFLCVTERISPFYTDGGGRGRQDFQQSFWYMFGALLTQGGESVPASPSGRTLISGFWLFSIVLVGTYSGNLIAFLTVPLNKPPFNSLEEMIAQTEYKWGTVGGTFFVTWFNTSTVDTLQAVWAGIKQFNETDPEVLSSNPNVHIQKMYREKYVYFGDKVYMDIRKSNRCELMTAEEEIPNNYYAVGLPNNSLYTKMFSDQIIALQEGGILQTFKEKHWPKSIFCLETSGLQARPISLIDVQAAFYLIGIGMLLGLLVLALEFLLYGLVNKCSHPIHEKCIHLKTVETNPDITGRDHEGNNRCSPVDVGVTIDTRLTFNPIDQL